MRMVGPGPLGVCEEHRWPHATGEGGELVIFHHAHHGEDTGLVAEQIHGHLPAHGALLFEDEFGGPPGQDDDKR